MHPFLDVSSLTDEQILERLTRAYSYMNAQVSLGHNPTVHSIQEVILDLEEERKKRLEKSMADAHDSKFPDKNKPIELGKLDD